MPQASPRTVTARSLPPLAYAGDRPYDRAALSPAGGRCPGYNKPSGGLWLSPATLSRDGLPVSTSRTEHCAREGYAHCASPVLSRVHLAPGAVVAVVNGPQDYRALAAACGTRASQGSGRPAGLRWEAVAAAADAFWLTGRGAWLLGCLADPFSGWGAETVVVLNPAVLP